jgi:acyl dehydratase
MITRQMDVGQAMPAAQRIATIETLVRYAGASGDFYPMHYDLDAAASQGHSELSVHGLLKAAWLYQYVADWSAGWADIEELDIRYRAMDYRDRPVAIGGRVEAVAGGVIDLSIWTANDEGTTTTTGAARLRAHSPAAIHMTHHDMEAIEEIR